MELNQISMILFHILIILYINLSESLKVSSSSSVYLYDLSSDPYESNNLASSSDYTDALSTFTERTEYWLDKAVITDFPDTTIRSPTWEKIGGIGPWLTSDFVPRTIEQKYSYENAPNIVFVLVDDWGFNDLGSSSTYMSWTTPTIDKLQSEGILLENYYTYDICSPSRSAFLTGRYTIRTGLTALGPELPLDEITLGEELQSAGYKTYIIGKWHMGVSTYQHFPTNRGFDYFYGYLSGEETYYSKSEFEYDDREYFDLRENLDFVTNEDEIDNEVHSAYIYQQKAENVIKLHAENYSNKPMFLYYALQLIHNPYTAPEIYKSRCGEPSDNEDLWNYCGLNVMLDEVVANLTCTLEANGFSENTLLVISGDNGGAPGFYGNNYPFRGHKGTFYRGGVSNNAIIHSQLLDESLRGTSYSGNVHITDWLPTFMSLATNGEWTGSYSGAEIDGVNVWDAIVTNSESPHNEIVFYVGDDASIIQIGDLKYMTNQDLQDVGTPTYIFTNDQDSSLSNSMCDNPTLLESTSILHSILHKVGIHISTRKQPKENIRSSVRAHVILGSIGLLTIIILVIFTIRKQAFLANTRLVQKNHEKAYLLSSNNNDIDYDNSVTI